MDDNCLTHHSDEVLDGIIERIETWFGKMTATRGNEHTFLGLKLRFSGDGTVRMRMREYIEEAIVAFNQQEANNVCDPGTTALCR